MHIFPCEVINVNSVTCTAKQQTDKYLETEYTHATIELRMLLRVARQPSARQQAR
jgi:hypothetical protein